MVDILYSVIRRPIPTDPDQKDLYHVDKAAKDQKVKIIEEDDPHSQSNQGGKYKHAQQKSTEEKDQQLENKLEENPEGKGKYKDDDGVEHLDLYV